MAKIKVDNAEVIRHISTKGFALKSSYTTKKGETKSEYFTVWTEEQPPVGSFVSVEGLHSVKLEEYEKDGVLQRVAATHINFPTIYPGSPSAAMENRLAQKGAAAVMQQFPGATFGEATPIDDGAPF